MTNQPRHACCCRVRLTSSAVLSELFPIQFYLAVDSLAFSGLSVVISLSDCRERANENEFLSDPFSAAFVYNKGDGHFLK